MVRVEPSGDWRTDMGRLPDGGTGRGADTLTPPAADGDADNDEVGVAGRVAWAVMYTGR